MANFYQDQLQGLLKNPQSYSQTPGYQFAFDQGKQALERSQVAKGFGGSGNVLAELMRYGTGMAQQDYGARVDQLGKLSGQEQQYQLGLGQNRNTATANQNQYALGNRQADNVRYGQDNDMASKLFGQMNDFTLGQQQLQGNGLRDMMSYDLGRQRNGNDSFNQFRQLYSSAV